MGLILIIVAFMIIVWLIFKFCDNNSFYTAAGACCGLWVGLLVALIVVIIVGACNHLTEDSSFAALQEQHNILVYQLENNLYDNDNNIGLKELYNDILDYNQKIIGGRINSKKFMLDFFYPIDYDQLELIELSEGVTN